MAGDADKSDEELDLTQGKASVEEVIIGPTGHVSDDPPSGETAVESFRFVSQLLCIVCFNG